MQNHRAICQILRTSWWWAWVLYGYREPLQKLIESATSAERKATYLASFAEMLWRMGQAEPARAGYELARTIGLEIVDAARRKQLLATIDRGLQFVSDLPPDLISATPHPRPRSSVQDSLIPPFPITADGFRDVGPEETAARSRANGELMKGLYESAAAGDRAGIEHITESAATPFQKGLGMASLEHILIQQHEPELAEQYAKRIPETDSPSSPAKAEALSAAAEAWLRMSNKERARADFESAKQIVFAVPDLPLGRISVLASIAAAQSREQMMDDSNPSFRSAIADGALTPTQRGSNGREKRNGRKGSNNHDEPRTGTEETKFFPPQESGGARRATYCR